MDHGWMGMAADPHPPSLAGHRRVLMRWPSISGDPDHGDLGSPTMAAPSSAMEAARLVLLPHHDDAMEWKHKGSMGVTAAAAAGGPSSASSSGNKVPSVDQQQKEDTAGLHLQGHQQQLGRCRDTTMEAQGLHGGTTVAGFFPCSNTWLHLQGLQ